MFARAVMACGQIHIVVANAVLSIREPVPDAHWPYVLHTLEGTQFGTFHTCQFVAQHLVRQATGGKIIISSVHAEIPFLGCAGYNMAKAAITHLGSTVAAELVRHHINVNIIMPGWIDTPGERTFSSEDDLREGGHRVPWGRLGTPADIGGAVAFLVSADADYITDATLRVDGAIPLVSRCLELPAGMRCIASITSQETFLRLCVNRGSLSKNRLLSCSLEMRLEAMRRSGKIACVYSMSI